jgi:hypothetical protein
MRIGNRVCCALLAALLLVLVGCVSEQRCEFRGVLMHGSTATTNAPSVQPVSSDFQLLPNDSAEALTGYRLSPSRVAIVFVHDRQKYVSHDYRLTDDAVSAVYLSERGVNDPAWTAFLREDAAARDRADGVCRLQGSFKVERWKSDVDFRIRLAMVSSDPAGWKVDGVLTAHNEWGFHPWQATGLLLASMGLINEGPSGPK